ncbi:MAG: hypothetical protein HWQ43_08310 [Nostoc sp. JL31]|uniref:hypothetical protein n=1 Tax=Nostoc sp. JL31 TaxID=2815395 RepID=UPI0025E1097D|nr:hypothetical protein [Nostoc sp. JL31]MBN3889167.1 hypothetical protein [Nostoc sp. JL31]
MFPQKRDRQNNKCVSVAQTRHCQIYECDHTLVLPETATGRSPEQPLQLLEFDKQAALEVFCQGQTVIPFWCDACARLRQRVHQKLRDNLKNYRK